MTINITEAGKVEKNTVLKSTSKDECVILNSNEATAIVRAKIPPMNFKMNHQINEQIIIPILLQGMIPIQGEILIPLNLLMNLPMDGEIEIPFNARVQSNMQMPLTLPMSQEVIVTPNVMKGKVSHTHSLNCIKDCKGTHSECMQKCS